MPEGPGDEQLGIAFAVPCRSEWQMEELVEGARLVVGERLSIHETTTAIERQCGLERRAGSGFEA